MKNIAFVNSMKTWGGGEKWQYETALFFSERGYNVHFFLHENSKLHEALQTNTSITLHFVSVSGLSFLNPLKVNRIKNLLRSASIQVVVINLSPDLKLFGRAASKAMVPKIVYARAVAFPIKNTGLNRYIFSHWVTDVLANSRATAKAVLQNNPRLVSSEKIQVIYNPLDIEEFTSRACTPLYKKHPDEIVIGCLGRLESEKNHSFLVSLSVRLQKENIKHKILLGGRGSLEDALKQQIVESGVEENIVLTGFLPNVKDLLMSCDVFVLPSLLEGFGFVIAEANLCRVPVIAFKTGSIPELIDDEVSGFIEQINDVEAVAKRISYLKNHPDLRVEMGNAGFELVKERFSRKKIMAELEMYMNDGV